MARNARKHSLLEKDVVIAAGDGKEDQAEFDALLAEMRECWKPQGIAEDLLVREIAISYWRSARALRCERGELTHRHTVYNEEPELTETEELLIELKPAKEARLTLFGTSRGLNYLLERVTETRTEVESSGRISQESKAWLSRHVGGSWDDLSGKQALLTATEKKIAELSMRKAQIKEEELFQRNANLDRSAIPSRETLDRIHRYETANVRHRYKVEERLERLQSRRKENEKAIGGAGDDDEGLPII